MKERKRKILLGLIALVTLTASVMIAFATNVSGVGKAFGLAGHVANSVSATDFSVPTGSDPWGTTFDSSGLVWVALPGCDPSPICANTTPPGKLAVFNPATQTWVRSYTLPTGFGQPLFLAFDQQGRLWFPMPMTNSLGMLDTSSGTFQQWTVPTAASGPWDVAVDHNGNVWFTEHYTNQIGEFNPTKQTFTEIATPAANSDPYGITVDASNNIWFTENNPAVALIAEYTAQGQLKEYKIRNNLTVSMNLTPHLITIDHSGNIWWSEGWVSMFGELKITQAVPGTNNGVTEYSYQHVCSNCGTHTSGIAVDSYGNVWFDDSLQGEYGYMPITGGTATVYAIPTANGHSHDGLNIDSQNRVWFTEEFANKLALVTQSGIGSPSPTPTTPSPTATNPPGQGAVVGQDTFQRANQALWGTASDGQQWGGDANTASVFSIANNSGQIGGSGLYSAVLGPQVTDSEVLMSGSISKFAGANFGAVLHWTDTNDWYKAYLDGSNLIVQKKVKGAVTTLKQATFAASAGTPYSLRFRIVGTTLYAKVWPAGSAEPSAWMITTTDNSLPSGYAGLRAQTQGGSVVSYTSFVATSLTSSGSTPTPTPTPASSPTPTPTATVLPSPTATTPPGTGGVLGQDTFQRANQALWGTASDGQQWGGDANNASVFSIVNNSGQVGGSGLYSAVLGPQATDSEVLLSGSISKFAGANFGAVLHWTDTNDWYKAYLDGSNLIVQKKVKGAVTTLKQTAFTANAGTPYSLRFRIVGTTLYAKVWPVGNSEPTNWMITTTDNSLPSGYAGLRAQTQGGSVVSYNSFMATSLTSGGSTPTPTPTPSPTVTVTPTPSPTVTVSPSPTVTVTPTPSPTPTPPPSGSTIAQDTFQRANQALWGTASDGQTWGGDANNVAAFSIANNAGTLVGDGNNYNAVLGSQVADSQILATGSINRFNYSNFGVVLRWQDTNNWYKAYIDGANLVVQKKVNGVITTLGTAPFTAAANTSYNILFQAVGTTLSAKVWTSNTAVPGNWMVTANDSSFQSGYCGLRISAQSGSTVSYTAFIATQLP